MALHWELDKKIGAMKQKDGRVLTIYEGNPRRIALNRWSKDKESWRSMDWFAIGRRNMKTLLGLNAKKGFRSNVFENCGATDIYLLKEWRNAAHIVNDILKSGWDIKVHLVGRDKLEKLTEVQDANNS